MPETILPMFKSNLKVAIRSLLRNKLISFINIGGLAVGMAVAMLIGFWIYDELSYNRFHNHFDEIAELKVHADYGDEIYTINSHPMPLADALSASYGNDFKAVIKSTAPETHLLTIDEKSFSPTGRFMDLGAATMLGLKAVDGTVLPTQDAGQILISSSLSQKLFGNDEPIGKLLKLDNHLSVRVGGVYKDLPDNDEFRNTDFVAPFDTYLQANDFARSSRLDWNSQSIQIFVQLAHPADVENINHKISGLKLAHVSANQAKRKPVLFLQPMREWHLKSTFKNGKLVTSEQMKYIWFYATIGFFVLLLACINFVNLSTASSEKRAREVGIRKAIGSLRSQLISQFFSESVMIAALGFATSLLVVRLILPWFNGVAGKKIDLPLLVPQFWLVAILFVLVTGILAGLYPAMYLSAFRAVKVLKGPVRAGYRASLPRKALVVMQFTISIVLMIGTLVVYRQIEHAKDRSVGYTQKNLLTMQLVGKEFEKKFSLIHDALIQNSWANAVAASASPITSIWSTSNNVSWPGKDPGKPMDFATLGVTQDYGKTIGWKMIDGRDFSGQFGTDSSGVILNEKAAGMMGLKKATGSDIEMNGRHYTVLGLVKDLVMESPFQPTYPAIYFLSPETNCMFVRFTHSVAVTDARAKFEAAMKSIVGPSTLDYQFVDETYAAKFSAEERVGNLSGFFSALAIFISCLGIFGLATFVAERRTKEIGVRKVLGASVWNLWVLLSREFAVLVVIAFLIATPLAYYFMHNWLQSYEYRVPLSWWLFAAAGVGALLITLLTASYQGIRAAMQNPVKSLRSE